MNKIIAIVILIMLAIGGAYYVFFVLPAPVKSPYDRYVELGGKFLALDKFKLEIEQATEVLGGKMITTSKLVKYDKDWLISQSFGEMRTKALILASENKVEYCLSSTFFEQCNSTAIGSEEAKDFEKTLETLKMPPHEQLSLMFSKAMGVDEVNLTKAGIDPKTLVIVSMTEEKTINGKKCTPFLIEFNQTEIPKLLGAAGAPPEVVSNFTKMVLFDIKAYSCLDANYGYESEGSMNMSVTFSEAAPPEVKVYASALTVSITSKTLSFSTDVSKDEVKLK